METKLNKSLAEALDIEPIAISSSSTEIVEDSDKALLPLESTSEVDQDSDFARKNIRDLVAKGSSALDDLLSVAKLSEHPRAYEVAAAMLKNLSDMNKALLEIQEKRKALAPTEFKNSQNINVDKAIVFTGSTNELVKYLKNNVTKKEENGNPS